MQVSLQKREDVQTTLVALLIPHKGGCPLHHLCRDYHEMAGEEIPWKELGYCSLMKLLESMSNSIQIEFRNNMIFLKGIASNKSKHISKLVSRQKDQKPPLGRNMFKPSRYYSRTIPSKVYIPAEILTIIIGIVNEHPDGVNKEFVLHKVQACMPYTNITMSEMEEQLNRLSHKMYLSNNKYFPALRRPHSVNAKPLVVTVGGEELDNFSDGEGGEDFQFMSPKNVSIVLPTRSPIKVKSTSNFIQESVNATQFKCKSNTMDNSFKKVSVRPETNRSSLYSFYNCNDNAATYTNNHNCEKEEKDNCIESKHAEDLINSRIRFRLEKLIQNNPDGIWCAELPEKYLEEYKISLNYTELGFSSVREFASQLPDIFHCMQIDDTGDFKLYHSKGQIPSNNSKKKQKTDNLAKFHQIYLSDEESEALPMTLTLNTCNQLIPEGIVTIGESVGQLSVADLVSKEKPYVEVVVVEVFTPTFFWIQLRKKQKAFKTFMNDLHNFYVIKHQDYVIPPVILEKGLNCACIYNKIWHRGIIKTVKPDLQVTVMFYDYGTLKTYQPNEVYYLHRMFSILPAQAIPCGLYNVRPYQAAIWSRNATHQFAVRTSSIPLVATVEAQWINEMDNSMLITLTDTLEEEDVHINDWLVEKKLAEHGKMVCMKKRNFPFHYYVECQKRKQQNSKTPMTSRSSKTVESVRSIGKQSPKLQLLYEKLISHKRSSQSSNNTSKEFNDHTVARQSSNCDSVLNKTEEPLGSNHDNDERDDDSTPFRSAKERKICESSNEQDYILRNYSNIPKTYAYRFRIQDPEDESNILNLGDYSDIFNKKREFKQIDWSIAQRPMQQGEYITQRNVTEKIYKSISKKRESIPLAETYFSRAVQNSVHFVERDENIGWLPSGNVNKVEDPSLLVLKNIQKRAMYNALEKSIGIPKKILDLLMEKESSTEILESSTDTSKSINDTSSSASVQESSSIIGNDFSYSNDGDNKTNTSSENFQINSDSNSTSRIQNRYEYMKLRMGKQKLIEILSMKQHQSSHSSVLDSDDLSAENCCNNDSELNNNNTLHSTETKNMDLDTSKSFIDRIVDKNESCEESEPSVSSKSLESSRSLNKNESYEELEFVDRSTLSETSGLTEELVSVQSADTQEHNLTGQAIDKKEITLEAEELVENESEKISAELVPTSKSSLPDVMTAMASIPIFNDVDLESSNSGGEEWDVHIRHSDLCDFLKTDFPLNKNVDRTLEFDTRPAIKEISNLNSSEDTNGVDRNYNENDTENSSVDSSEYSNTTFKNSNNEHSTSASVKCSENIAESSSKTKSGESRRLRSLKLMLNKAKGDKVDMHNLLLYVEENLLHAPEQCYQTEGSTSNAVSDINEKVFANVPLISPQSTFEVQNLKLSSQQELPAEPDKSVNLQDQAQSTTDTFPRVIPQDKPICNQDKNKISPENLIQLWNENLKLQIQISSIFEILFNKAMTKSETDDNSMKNENTLNTMSDTHHFDVNDIQKVGKLSRDLLNDNSNINNYTDFLQYSLKQLNTFCSGITTVEDSNLDKANQLFPNKSAVSRIPPGFETVAPKANLDRSNQFTNTVNTDLPETLKKPASFNIHLKETNPFKADLLNELQKSQEENYLNSGDLFCSKKNQEPVVKHDIAVFKEDNTDFPDTNLDVTKKISEKNPFVYQEYYSTCQLSTPDSTDTNPKFLFTDYPRPNVTKNIGIASNSFSMIHSVNDLHGATNRRETESENRIFPGNYDAYKYTPSYLRNRSQEHEQMQEENVMLKHPSWTITPCTDYAPSYNNSATSTWLPINSFPSPVVTMQDSKSIDEGYLTGPSTSHTLDRLSPLTQRIADPDKYSASAKIRSTSAEDKLVQFEKCYQMYLQSLESEGTETTSNLRPSQNSKFHSVPTDISLDRKVYIKLIELPKRQIHIVHYQKQGWLLMEDFISFTKLPDVSYILDILQILDFPMPFVEVDGAQCSIEFFKSTSSCEQQTKDIMHSFDNLCLIPLKSALKLLKKLKVISAQELQDVLTHNKFEIGSITDEIWVNINDTYGVRLHVSNISYNLI